MQRLLGQGAQQLMDSVLARAGMSLLMSVSPAEQQELDSNGLVPCGVISCGFSQFLFFFLDFYVFKLTELEAITLMVHFSLFFSDYFVG